MYACGILIHQIFEWGNLSQWVLCNSATFSHHLLQTTCCAIQIYKWSCVCIVRVFCWKYRAMSRSTVKLDQFDVNAISFVSTIHPNNLQTKNIQTVEERLNSYASYSYCDRVWLVWGYLWDLCLKQQMLHPNIQDNKRNTGRSVGKPKKRSAPTSNQIQT